MILIETPRLLFRHFELTDAQAVLEFNSDPRVTQYTGDAGNLKTLEDARKVITEVWLKDYKKYGYGRYAVVLKSTGKVIGFSGLKYLEELSLPDLGYRFMPEYWRQGLGLEAAQACLNYGFERLDLATVYAMAMPENAGSIAILSKLGFKALGTKVYYGDEVATFQIERN